VRPEHDGAVTVQLGIRAMRQAELIQYGCKSRIDLSGKVW
jgi:hypothetical protein